MTSIPIGQHANTFENLGWPPTTVAPYNALSFGVVADGETNTIDQAKEFFSKVPDKSIVVFPPGKYIMGVASNGENYIRVYDKNLIIFAEGAEFFKSDGSGYNLFQFRATTNPSSQSQWQSGDYGLDFLCWYGGVINGNKEGQEYPINSTTGTWNQDLANAGLLGIEYAKKAEVTVEIVNNVSDGVVLVNPLFGNFTNCLGRGGAKPYMRYPQNFKYRPLYGPTRCDVNGLDSTDGNIAVSASSPTAPVGSSMYIRAVKSRGAAQGSIYIECCETVYASDFDVDSLVHLSNETVSYSFSNGLINGARFDSNNTGGAGYSEITAVEVKNNPSTTTPAINALQCKNITNCKVLNSSHWGISGQPSGKVVGCTVDGYVGRGISFGDVSICTVLNGSAASTGIHRPAKVVSSVVTTALRGIEVSPNDSTIISASNISATAESGVYQAANGTGVCAISGAVFDDCGNSGGSGVDACINLDVAHVTVTGSTFKNSAKAITNAGNAGALLTVLFVGNTLTNIASVGETDNGTTRIIQNNIEYP